MEKIMALRGKLDLAAIRGKVDIAAIRGKLDVGAKYLLNNKTSLIIGFLLLGNLLLFIKLRSNGDHGDDVRRRERTLDLDELSDGPQYLDYGGSMFTRWGRTVCPEADQLVYAGVAGGGHYTHKGSGSNYLCLPMDPIFDKIKPGVQNAAIIHGAEYQTNFELFSNANTNADSLTDHNVPCAVCYTPRTVMMIPGRNECYNNWRMEYKGYLMASHYGHEGRSEYVCMDEVPEADQAGYRNENGALFYHVEGACGSLPCPPYADGKELTCVVCTK